MNTETKPRDTIFSPCRKYRYTLWREWDSSLPYCQFIGLNPSTADETKDDNTIRKCVKFAKSWGFGALCMTNIFAWRDTDPKDMKRAQDPVGPDNDRWLLEIGADAGLRVAAWGNHGTHINRAKAVAIAFEDALMSLSCFRVTKERQPEHPLYQRDDATLFNWPTSPNPAAHQI